MATTLEKPAGLPVLAPHGDPRGDCLLRRLLEAQPWRAQINWPPGFAGGIAHRLDNATSGAIVVADSLAELAQLRDWFAAHRLTKTYLMLAAKDVPWHENHCDAAIAHHPTKKSLMVVQRGRSTAHRGKWYPAQTHFRRRRGRLFEVTMTGGVMHQIRVHAAFVGIPIIGDRRYGGAAAAHHADLTAIDPPVGFCLHHVGMRGPDGFRTDPVPTPAWAPLDDAGS